MLLTCVCSSWNTARMHVHMYIFAFSHQEEDPVPSHHGVAYVDLSALLYPGVSRVRGAYQVHPYDESEFLVKVRTHVHLTMDAM